MATQIGVVKALIGEVTAMAADGSVRTLQIGDMVYANELVSTGEGGAVEIEFADGSVMDLGRNSQAMLDSEVFDPSATAIAETASDDVPDDIAAIQQALLEGEDPTQVGEATAAGAGVEGGNEGHEPVFVDYLNPEVTPDAGFDTIGVSNSYDLPEEDIIILEEEEAPPVVPVVSVSVDVEIEIEDPQSPPPEDGVPTPEYPVLVNGNAASVLEGTSEGTKQVVFIINLSESFSQDVQVTYILQPVSANGAADNPEDWFDGSIGPQTVTIPAGSTSFPVYVEIVEDNIPEANGVFEIVLISANNATINPDADSAMVTIYDDDVTLVSDDVTGDETDGLVELDGVIDADFGPGDTGSISISLSGGSWVGSATASTNTLTADDGSWTLVVNNDGTYTFTQNAAFDHPDTTNPDDPLTFEFTATATDSSGNTSAPSVFTVTVNDDGPTAQDDDAGTIAEDSSISVDVLANDAAGADGGKALVSIDTMLDPLVGTVSIVDGEIVFTAAAGFEGDVSIDYTMQDAEGDTDSATLTLTVGPDSVPSVLTVIADDGAVDESALAGGTGGGSLTTSGTFNVTHSGTDTTASLTVDGVVIAEGTTTYVNTGTYGTLAVTESGGVYSWVYTLNSNAPHTDASNTGAADQYPEDTYDVVVTDSDGDATDDDGVQASEQLVIQINDDGPVAQDDDAGTIAEDSSISVDVLANDAAGADGGKALVSIDTVLDPLVGTVSIVDGEIVFTAAAGFEGDVSIDYTMQDAEGDTDSATLTLTVGPDSVPVLTSSNAAVDETGGLDSVNGTLTINFGNDESGSTVMLSSNYDAATTSGNTLTANDGSWQLVRNANGTYTFTQLAAMDHSGIANNGSIDIQFTVDVVDGDGTPGTESFTVSVYDDGPVVTDNDANLVNGAGTLANILSYDLGEDGLGDSGSVQLSYNGPALKSGGEDVIFTSEDADGDGIYDLVGTAGGEEVIRIAQSLPDASPEDGSYSIVMSDVIDLPIVNIEVPLESLAISGSTGTYSVGGEVVLTLTGNGDLKLSNAGGSDKLGVGNNNMDPGETLTFDFGGDVVNGLALDLFDNADGYQYSYVATRADGTTFESDLITGAGSSNIDPINIPGGYTSITITVEDDGSISQPKFKISGISYDAEDPQGITLDFGYTATDGDGDAVIGEFEVTIDPSAAVNAITGTPDVISHPDTQVDPS